MKTCQICERKHWARGFCHNHFNQMKYHNDPKYRERQLKRLRKYHKDYYERKSKEDPTWNARKQKKFRLKHPDKFNYMQCRWFYKKLSEEQRKKLREEVV